MSLPSELNALVQQSVPGYPPEANARYKAYFFGPFRVVFENQPLGEFVWRRNKAKALLKWFLLNPGKLFTVDQLIKLFWPDLTQASAARNLHVTIHNLRHLLEPELAPHQESRFVRRNKHNYYWFQIDESWWVDAYNVQQQLTMAKEAERGGNDARAIHCYRQIAQYCQQGFLPEDVYGDTFYQYRQQYDYIYMQTLEKLIQLCAQHTLLDEVQTYSLQALSLDPYCETAIKAMIDAYFRQGNATGALRKLDDFQNLLQQELGMEISEDIRRLRKQILKER